VTKTSCIIVGVKSFSRNKYDGDTLKMDEGRGRKSTLSILISLWVIMGRDKKYALTIAYIRFSGTTVIAIMFRNK
jgi:hypothetical protein